MVRQGSAWARFSAQSIALASVFVALWTTLNIVVAPLGFAWFGLPVFCDFSVFFTLLLVVWASGRFGVASVVGVVGSLVVLLLRGQPTILGFMASALLFDGLMVAGGHRVSVDVRGLVGGGLATVVSAYFAGVMNATVFMGRPLLWAATFWGGWNVAGGVVSLVVVFSMVGVLERSGVRRLRNG
jgi:hypothetical protein